VHSTATIRDQCLAFKPNSAPCFPGYPSAGLVLQGRNGGRDLWQWSRLITLRASAGRKYTRLNEITDDISDARVYGGIHFRTDQDGGEFLGTRIARWIYEHTLQSAHGGGSHQQ
jgi:hypothetical protein